MPTMSGWFKVVLWTCTVNTLQILSGACFFARSLRDELRKRSNEVNHLVLTAAKLVAPSVDKTSGKLTGYDWVVEQMNAQVILFV